MKSNPGNQKLKINKKQANIALTSNFPPNQRLHWCGSTTLVPVGLVPGLTPAVLPLGLKGGPFTIPAAKGAVKVSRGPEPSAFLRRGTLRGWRRETLLMILEEFWDTPVSRVRSEISRSNVLWIFKHVMGSMLIICLYCMLTILHNIFVDWLIAPKGAVVTPRHRFGSMSCHQHWTRVSIYPLQWWWPLDFSKGFAAHSTYRNRSSIYMLKCRYQHGMRTNHFIPRSIRTQWSYTLALVHVTILSGNKTPGPTELQVTSQWNSTKNTAKVLFILALLTALLVTSMMSSAFVVLLPRHFASPCGASF